MKIIIDDLELTACDADAKELINLLFKYTDNKQEMYIALISYALAFLIQKEELPVGDDGLFVIDPECVSTENREVAEFIKWMIDKYGPIYDPDTTIGFVDNEGYIQ